MTIQECIDKWKRVADSMEDQRPLWDISAEAQWLTVCYFIKDLEEIRDRPGPEFTMKQPET